MNQVKIWRFVQQYLFFYFHLFQGNEVYLCAKYYCSKMCWAHLETVKMNMIKNLVSFFYVQDKKVLKP
ncbi:MAG: hypothetical protein DRR19_29430 [Candidatus Parabeggiatoa sp. nov. 1]|nr:MAG: hypothetical protein DRR19_29430 [Gammaproteobacteria bacterium]